jgi:hypothetical protein
MRIEDIPDPRDVDPLQGLRNECRNERAMILSRIRDCYQLAGPQQSCDISKERLSLIRSKLSFLIDWMDRRTKQDTKPGDHNI